MRARLNRIERLIKLLCDLRQTFGIYSAPNIPTLLCRLTEGVYKLLTYVWNQKQSADKLEIKEKGGGGKEKVNGELRALIISKS